MIVWPLEPSHGDYVPKTHNYRTISRTIVAFLEESTFLTIEVCSFEITRRKARSDPFSFLSFLLFIFIFPCQAMATSVANILLNKCNARKAQLYVEKPSALLLAKSAGIQIVRERNDQDGIVTHPKATSHIAFIGLGSNLGNRDKNISAAIQQLSQYSEILDTSFLYETPPSFVTDQPLFYNAACKVR